MEHSAEYKKIMRARKKREMARRRRVFYIILALFAAVVVAGVSMIIISGAIRKEHKKAVEIYNENNWARVETDPLTGNRSVYGLKDGKSFSYVDDGRYYEGITVDGVELGGMTYSEARQAVIGIIEKKLGDISMAVVVGNASLTLSAQDFNIKVNADDILEKAFSNGREHFIQDNAVEDCYANYQKQQKMKENAENGHPIEYHLRYECDRNAIMKRVDSIASFVNTEPVEPYLTISQRPTVFGNSGLESETIYAENGAAIAYVYFHPGKNGFVLNKEVMVDRVVTAFESGDYNCLLSADLEDTAPGMTVDDIREGFKKITGYSTDFPHGYGTINRRRNIQKAAEILNGCTIAPGQEISFNEYIGPRTEEGGWLPAPGITGGKEYVNSPGGGICQVSGTLYNALLQCGPNKIKITQRRHHSWPSEYVPYGLDCTVDTHGPDLKWRNISDYPIYIFAYADTENGKMYVYVFTLPEEDGSYYETWAETIEEIEPEPTVTRENPMWPMGYKETTIKSRKGYTAKAYLKHFDANGELIETIYLYTDRYNPVQGVITIGTGDPSLPTP